MEQFNGFAVFDLETTGLNPKRGDRIVQIAVNIVDKNFNIVEKWDSYINPERQMGSTRIHGITSEKVQDAPTFKEIAPKILEVFKNKTLVAHNYKFDGGFLETEFNKIGQSFKHAEKPHFCTKENAILWLPQIILHTLSNCAKKYKIEFEGKPHNAKVDTEVTAKLLQHYLNDNPNNVYRNIKPQPLNI